MNLRRLITDENGQGLVEYAMLLSMIALVCVAAVTLLGDVIVNNFYQVITDTMPGG